MFLHKDIISVLKRIKLRSDMVLYIILIGRRCHIFLHTQTEVKSDHSKSGPVSNWNMYLVPFVHHAKILSNDFSAKVDIEDIFKQQSGTGVYIKSVMIVDLE